MQTEIRVSLEDKPGALMRVAGIVTSLGVNIESLTVAPDPRQRGISTLILIAELEPLQLRNALRKMNSLVNVIVAELRPCASAEGGLRWIAERLDPESGLEPVLPHWPPGLPDVQQEF